MKIRLSSVEFWLVEMSSFNDALLWKSDCLWMFLHTVVCELHSVQFYSNPFCLLFVINFVSFLQFVVKIWLRGLNQCCFSVTTLLPVEASPSSRTMLGVNMIIRGSSRETIQQPLQWCQKHLNKLFFCSLCWGVSLTKAVGFAIIHQNQSAFMELTQLSFRL